MLTELESLDPQALINIHAAAALKL